MTYNYNSLTRRIKEKFNTQKNFSKKIGLSRTSLNLRLNNKREFSQEEILKSIKVLDLKEEDIPEYFFKLKVHKTERNLNS
ncbi:DUF739 family protein [Clostridioides difficile]|uniref:DUF739 family protein n=1 Tax=Clostridioides difficile TaxID=1496 RepID=UPI001431E11D|nr:DUF739 family protein [Clostridioides difficile]MCK3747742.1 DUF739 family protein [Clostridioides difficile]MCP8397029.1 DUF739 family protein [Clostridioides difficile]MCP8415787.1 DUF739 family protein [Clostridioides difficile]MCP8493743.1 DUF739 family protein [Clostridioides difficile]MCP8656873.1 DUF739 family protein [Clostridioides difficile]